MPIVKQLGYEYPEGEPADLSQLRTTAITQAAGAKDPEYVFFIALHLNDNVLSLMSSAASCASSKRGSGGLSRVVKALQSLLISSVSLTPLYVIHVDRVPTTDL